MDIIKITDATVEPVTLAEAKMHLRESLDDVGNDAYITSLITAARVTAEERLRRTLLLTTWRAALDGFPAGGIELPMPRLIGVESVKYFDRDNVEQTLAPSDWLAVTTVEPGQLMLAPSCSWPSTYSRPGAVTVQYRAGYGTSAAAVPMPIRQWIKLALGALYERRSLASPQALNEFRFADSLLDPYRVYGAG